MKVSEITAEPIGALQHMGGGIGGHFGPQGGLYGFGPTAYYVLKVARYLGLNV